MEVPALSKTESLLGLKLFAELDKSRVLSVHPGSAADKAGLAPGDELIALDNMKFADPELHFKDGQKVAITFFRDFKLRTTEIVPSSAGAYKLFRISFNAKANSEQKKNFAAWSSRTFPS